MAEIILESIVKRYDKLVAVKNLNLDIKDKEFLVLLGPSGCGKTTTLRCISGLEIPDEGRIMLDGRNVTKRRASQRDIAFVFQLYALYPILTVYENIAFPLKAQKYDKKRIKEEVAKVAEILQITHILNRKPKELSGGDMQRVALGRAMVRRPKAFLLDEPIGTLDAKFREEMRVELKRLHIDIGATTVYVTHDQVEAMSMGDRIAIMNQGVLQQVGTPYEVYSKPNNLFVANFIGSPGMNFINCVPKKKGGKLSLALEKDDILIPLNKALASIVENEHDSKKLVLGIRPEDVSFSTKKSDEGLDVTVYVSEETGSYNIIDVNLGSQKVKVRTLPTVKPAIGDPAYIELDMNRVSIFDKESGGSIMK
ncbi:MAG: ABC transporter ATP-binding protein [Spirochaetes bacterium]|nr:ABC transporter ATP-binding protein [Spirochaetota bacterium]